MTGKSHNFDEHVIFKGVGMYINKISQAGKYVLVSNYTPRFFGAPSRKRRQKMKETPEAMAKYNNHKRAEKLQLLMLLNFDKGYHITLDYPKDNRPETYEEAETKLKKFLYKMSRRLKSKNIKFKYIAITERGRRREALHHHMVIEGEPFLLKQITELWGNHIKISQMYEDGAYKDLADYFCKIETKEEQTKGKSKYHRSRNLKEPQTKARLVAGALNNEPYIPDGYELIRDTLVNGFNDYAGIRYQKYMIKRSEKVKSEQKGRKKTGVWESLKNIFRKRDKHG
jgi:hypothetical protein